MTEAIVVALITGGLALAGTVISVLASSRKTEQILQAKQAVTEERITELTREVREHNNFAKRMPVVEEQVKVMNHRIKDLEQEMFHHEN